MKFPEDVAASFPVQLAGWLACLFFVVALANALASFIGKMRGQAPQPPNEQLESSIRRINADVDAIKADQSLIWEKINSNYAATEAANEKRAHDIHVRLNAVAEDTSNVRGQMIALNSGLQEFTKICIVLAQK